MSTETPKPDRAGVTRTCCMCQTRHPVTGMGNPGPGLWACLDADACADRQDAIGPQTESIELAVSRHEAARGAVRRPQPVLTPGDASDIRPRTGELIGKGAPA